MSLKQPNPLSSPDFRKESSKLIEHADFCDLLLPSPTQVKVEERTIFLIFEKFSGNFVPLFTPYHSKKVCDEIRKRYFPYDNYITQTIELCAWNGLRPK